MNQSKPILIYDTTLRDGTQGESISFSAADKLLLAKRMDQGSPMASIRMKCLDCCSGQAIEVKNCPIPDCPLYQLRFGKRPATLAENGDSWL